MAEHAVNLVYQSLVTGLARVPFLQHMVMLSCPLYLMHLALQDSLHGFTPPVLDAPGFLIPLVLDAWAPKVLRRHHSWMIHAAVTFRHCAVRLQVLYPRCVPLAVTLAPLPL